MRILFLHLSDLHLKDPNSVSTFQIKKIVDTLNVQGAFNRLILILSGDITSSGESPQFDAAYKFIGSFITIVKEISGYSSHIDILCVPGNHDLNHNGESMTSECLQGIHKANLYEEHLPAEIDKMTDFYNYAVKNCCFKNKEAFWQMLININGFILEANLINSAVFSILEEDKGLHYIPQRHINAFNVPTSADFVITVMHHSPDWYIDSQKNLLDDAIYGKSSLVFYGHEHNITTKAVSHERNAAAFVQSGGCLCENDDWSKSTYNVGLLDTDTMVYSLCKFCWNGSEKQYEVKEKMSQTLTKKPSIEKHIDVIPSYLTTLLTDFKHDLSEDFHNYFVFPRIQAEDQDGTIGKEYIGEKSLIDEIIARKRVLITGGYNSGKTTLLKSLFCSLSREFIVIYCDITDIRGKHAERIIKNCFVEIYGESPSDYNRFIQMPKEKRILIIDDIDQIAPTDFEHFIQQLCETFEYFIFTSKQVININLLDRMKLQLKTTDLIYKFKIAPFYADKRYELIEKVVNILSDDHDSVPKTTRLLSDAIKAQKRFISLDPDFIIKYVEYYCKNIGEAMGNDSGVFSKVFEASLINAIGKYQTGKLSVDKIFVLLSKIAHNIHFHKVYPIMRTRVLDIIEEYNIDYGAHVNGIEAIDVMTKSKILTPTENDDGYRFANNNYLAFFVAREVNSQYNTTGNDSDLQKILQCSCFGINSDILLFISYITDNIRILRLIIQTVNDYTSDWPEFDFSENIPKFLKSEKKHIVDLPAKDARKKEREAEIASEKVSSTELRTVEIYDYSEETIDEFVNQIIRACSLLIVVSKCLPNFEHNMPKEDKDAFVNAIYKLPNKIFYLWASEADKEIDEIIRYFKEQSQDYFTRQKPKSDDDFLKAFQWGAMSLLLDLYNIGVVFSTKDNTVQYLDSFNYEKEDTYSLEHLMMLEKQNASTTFTESALNLYDDRKGHIYLTLLKRIVNHAFVFMDNFEFRLKQRLQTKFFPSKEHAKELMIQRKRNSNKVNE